MKKLETSEGWRINHMGDMCKIEIVERSLLLSIMEKENQMKKNVLFNCMKAVGIFLCTMYM